MSDTYTCENCNGVFEKGQSDEAAAAELTATFPGFAPDDCSIVCDDCYQKMMAWARALPEEELKSLLVPTTADKP